VKHHLYVDSLFVYSWWLTSTKKSAYSRAISCNFQTTLGAAVGKKPCNKNIVESLFQINAININKKRNNNKPSLTVCTCSNLKLVN